MHRNREQIAADNPEVTRKFSMLVKGFKHECAWWEGVVYGRKILLTGCSVLFASDKHVQGLMSLFVLAASVTLHREHLPFCDRELNTLETCSLACSFMIFFLGQFTFVDSILSDPSSIMSLSVLAFLFNMALVVAALHCLVKILQRRADAVTELDDEQLQVGTEEVSTTPRPRLLFSPSTANPATLNEMPLAHEELTLEEVDEVEEEHPAEQEIKLAEFVRGKRKVNTFAKFLINDADAAAMMERNKQEGPAKLEPSLSVREALSPRSQALSPQTPRGTSGIRHTQSLVFSPQSAISARTVSSRVRASQSVGPGGTATYQVAFPWMAPQAIARAQGNEKK